MAKCPINFGPNCLCRQPKRPEKDRRPLNRWATSHSHGKREGWRKPNGTALLGCFLGKRTKLSTHAMFFGVGALQTYVQKAHMKFDLLWSDAFHFVGTVNVEKKGTFPSCTITQCQKRFCVEGEGGSKKRSFCRLPFPWRRHQVQILGGRNFKRVPHESNIEIRFFGGSIFFQSFRPKKMRENE